MGVILFFKTYWKKILIALGIIILIVTIATVYQNCKPQPKIDLDAVTKINIADEKARKEELTKQILKNADVIKSADKATALTELSVEERDRQIAIKVKEANKKIEDAKAQGRDVTQEELQCLLIPDDCK